jgi:hypothetical protein
MSKRVAASFAACAVALLGTLLSHEASATSCGHESLRRAMARNMSDVVFDGTVQTVQRVSAGEIVTFEARQVWKGSVSKQFIIHNMGAGAGASGGMLFPFEQAQRYIVFAHRMTAEERALFGFGDVRERFGTGMCRDGSQPVAPHVLSELSEIPPGRPPR